MRPTLIVIVGPTGVGKTGLAVKLAKYFETEIISADSRQVFAETIIGTAQPSQKELAEVKHHMIGTKSLSEYYNASMFEQDVISLLEELFFSKDRVILVGGSGFYVDAVLKGIDDLPAIDQAIRTKVFNEFQEKGMDWLRNKVKQIDPVYYANVDKNNPKRMLKAVEVFLMTGKPYSGYLTAPSKKRNFESIKIGLNMDREKLYDKINQRVDLMIDSGLIDEARRLHHLSHLNSLNTVGYKELFEHFDGKITLEEAIIKIKSNSRSYARRQLTWFRRDKTIRWFEPDETQKIIDYLNTAIKR